MKRNIKKTLMAGVLACSAPALNARAEVNPWGLHAKLGVSISSFWGYGDDVKFGSDKANNSFFGNPWLTYGIHGEYAFNSYMGVDLGGQYLYQGGEFRQEKSSDSSGNANANANQEKWVRVRMHTVNIPISFCIYPLGREEDESILKVFLGVAPQFRLAPSVQKNKSGSNSNEEEDIPSDTGQYPEHVAYDIAGQVGVEFEHSSGFLITLKGAMGIMNVFKEQSGADKQILTSSGITGLKNMQNMHTALTVGYNFMRLYAE